jgi:hypothetical protein
MASLPSRSDIVEELFEPQDPDEIDFEIEGLEEDMARFKELKKSGVIPTTPEPEKKPRDNKKNQPPGEQASLF